MHSEAMLLQFLNNIFSRAIGASMTEQRSGARQAIGVRALVGTVTIGVMVSAYSPIAISSSEQWTARTASDVLDTDTSEFDQLTLAIHSSTAVTVFALERPCEECGKKTFVEDQLPPKAKQRALRGANLKTVRSILADEDSYSPGVRLSCTHPFLPTKGIQFEGLPETRILLIDSDCWWGRLVSGSSAARHLFNFRKEKMHGLDIVLKTELGK